MALILNPITGQEYPLTDEEIKHITVNGEVINIKGQLLEVAIDDLKDFSLRVVVDRNDVAGVIFVPRHDQAKRWYRNWLAVRIMKVTNKSMDWCREYVRKSRGVRYANEDEVFTLTATLDRELAMDQYHACIGQRGGKMIEYLRNYGFEVDCNYARVEAVFQMLGLLWGEQE